MAAITANLREFRLKDWASAMANRTGKPRPALSTLLNLAGFGLAAVASIFFCGIASFSFLSTSKEMRQISDIRDREVDVNPVRPPVPVDPELLGSGAEAAFGTPPRDNPPVRDTPPREASGTQSASEPAPPGASEASATQEVALSGTASPPPNPADQPDWVSHGIEMQNNQKVNLDTDDAAASDERMTRQVIQQNKSYEYYYHTNGAAWRYRLIRECGPIKDRVLYDDCFRSFKAQYPAATRTR
jgi:hypothetical protein